MDTWYLPFSLSKSRHFESPELTNLGPQNSFLNVFKNMRTLPDNELSSWHLAKSHTLTVVSSEQEQNFKSVLQKLFKKKKKIEVRSIAIKNTRKSKKFYS